jgi:serine/threonine protein kinase
MPAEDARPTDTHLGHYRLLHEIGRGGQAVVWLAEDARIKRKVALKVLPALGPGSERVLERFKQEAEVTSKLEHPAICAVYEADLKGGVPFIAMRYVEGETLARRVAATREKNAATVSLRAEPSAAPDWNEIATFFAKTARALHAAHEAGVVHRDVKPANLMITPQGEPVILDFGLARQDDSDSQAMSLSGQHSGTPIYMSPEQISGRLRPDRRSDVYSLGCALFEALTGRPPFEAPTLESLFHAILHVEATSVSRVNTAVPEDLAVITATATAKERERRYKTALDMALDLERFVRLEPIAARPVTSTQRAIRWARRNPALAAALAAVVVLGLLATGLLSYGVGAAGRAALEAQLREQSETERKRMVQAAADKELAGRMDELNMKFGTLYYGFEGGQEYIESLLPSYVSVLREAGIDFANPDAVAIAKASIETMRARDDALATALIEVLQSLGAITTFEAASRQRLSSLLEGYEDPRMEAYARAATRWSAEKVDEFEALLTEAALARLDPYQLAQVGSMLFTNPGRFAQGEDLIDRAILAQPDSFKLHYMRGGMAMSAAARNREGPDAERLARTAVMHFKAAVALRPRSGVARASLAGAQAMLALVTNQHQGFQTSWRTMESATRVDPQSAMTWFFRGDYLRHTPGGKPRAIEACNKALELDPGFAPARKLLEQLSR